MSFIVSDCVGQVTTATGAGDLLLGAALDGLRRLDQVAAAGDVFVYEIHAVVETGARTGDFEVGVGQLVASGADWLLRRHVVRSSSADGDPVSFAAGTKHVTLTACASQVVSAKLDSLGRPIYVRAAGTGTSGLESTSAEALSDPAAAGQLAMQIAKFNIINIGAGTFTNLDFSANDGSTLLVVGAGNASTFLDHIVISGNVSVDISNLSVGYVRADRGAQVTVNDVACAATDGAGHFQAGNGCMIELGDVTITGGATSGAHLVAEPGGAIAAYGNTSFAADVSFGVAYAACLKGLGHIDAADATFSLGGHTVTGKRYDVRGNGVIFTNGGSASFLPGNAAGTAANGGQYL